MPSVLLVTPTATKTKARRIVVKPGAIAAYLKHADISRDELARRIGVDTATAYRVDKGDVDPSPKFIAGFMIEAAARFEQLFLIRDADK